MKTQLTLAAVVAAGLLASGCSQQMVGQQAVADQGVVTPEPPKTIVKTIVDCSKCKRPTQPPRGGNMHTHRAIPGCTDSIKHNHPHPQGGRHSHKYGCKKQVRPTPRPARPVMPVVKPRPAPVTTRPAQSGHVHPAIPNCTDSIRHNHPSARGGAHTHRYVCRGAQRPQIQQPRPPRPYQPVPVMPKVKAKGTYKGAIQIDGVMQQYQQ